MLHMRAIHKAHIFRPGREIGAMPAIPGVSSRGTTSANSVIYLWANLWITWRMRREKLGPKALDALAAKARTFAEAQALSARADRLRGHRPSWFGSLGTQFLRN